jgi:hypothetical protein
MSILITFEPNVIFEAAGAVSKIDLSLKPIILYELATLQISHDPQNLHFIVFPNVCRNKFRTGVGGLGIPTSLDKICSGSKRG